MTSASRGRCLGDDLSLAVTTARVFRVSTVAPLMVGSHCGLQQRQAVTVGLANTADRAPPGRCSQRGCDTCQRTVRLWVACIRLAIVQYLLCASAKRRNGATAAPRAAMAIPLPAVLVKLPHLCCNTQPWRTNGSAADWQSSAQQHNTTASTQTPSLQREDTQQHLWPRPSDVGAQSPTFANTAAQKRAVCVSNAQK